MKKIILSLLTLLGINIGVKAQIDKLETGLTKTLELTAHRFEKTNNAFLINLIKDNTVIMQIVHGALVEKTAKPGNPFNFSFNLTFDNEKTNENAFKNLELSKNFEYYEWDGIPCYALNVGNNKPEAKKIALEILNKVYGYDSDELFKFELFDQGRL
ncbi:hypothetical protein [Aquimarina aquimarini]|uniref:hypothetical protein n=1 Tax=Aquimarina aquimarini TaxID=1191734 RepID=UPI000D557032|nr:hypothetical protein [Aquimarina aquimarini]